MPSAAPVLYTYTAHKNSVLVNTLVSGIPCVIAISGETYVASSCVSTDHLGRCFVPQADYKTRL